MVRSLSLYHFLVSLIILITHTLATGISIGEYDGFGYMRPCAQGCLSDVGNDAYHGFDAVYAAIGCSAPAQNECWCRADLQDPAYTWLSKCATSRCGTTATVDQASVLSIYQHYCATAMATVEGGGARVTGNNGLPRQTGLASLAPAVRNGTLPTSHAVTVTRVVEATQGFANPTGLRSGAGVMALHVKVVLSVTVMAGCLVV
ncbi:hypothetical protein B0T16DRAFT_492504 [Cercophora newfieldiana]|uniref:Extracellular membrane protein CFEM domain-containing protein n=1 Tax=Cercophora newfieldiana TaxID=92897 RepID=A0AA40CTD5_9PEZI|nr:hypothetical protein B0T16DRAFT_492504 [Cercophora newfieldiana]